MKNYLLIILLFGLNLHSIFGLDKVNEKLLQHAINGSQNFHSVNELHDYLIEASQNENEELELFFYWISQNIKYDIERYLSITRKELVNEIDILKTKKGVCEDYSNLFKLLCDISGIECYKVVGYCKGFEENPNKELTIDHAWNIVKLNGNYEFVDCTWGSGYVDYDDKGNLKYHKKLGVEQVFVNTEKFRESHLPGSPKWQLLVNPISYKNFESKENFSEMKVNYKFDFNFEDSIKYFRKLDPIDKLIKEWQSIYKFNPTSANSLATGTYFEIAASRLSTIKEFDMKEIMRAKNYYKIAKNYYSKSNKESNNDEDEIDEEFLKLIKNVDQGITYCNYRIISKN